MKKFIDILNIKIIFQKYFVISVNILQAGDFFKMLLYILSFGTILGTNYAIPLFGIPLGASLIQEAAL